MTEPFLNLLEGKALLKQERRDRMPQIVKPDARQTGAAADAPELAGNIVRAERRAVLTDADIIALVVGFAVFPAVFLRSDTAAASPIAAACGSSSGS